MTDLTGRCFVSYRRTRLTEIELVVGALHDLGIPTWQDISNLDADPTSEGLRGALENPATASALMWITPDVAGSDIIRKIEIPEILNRRSQKDGFHVQPIAAGGLDYAEATEIGSRHLGIDDLTTWNLDKADADPIDAADAEPIAELVLRRRLKEIVARLADAEPMRIWIETRQAAPVQPGVALTLDWSHRFHGREATAETWDERLLPALNLIGKTIREVAPRRPVVAEGRCALPAAVALGAAFLAPAGTELRWIQRKPGRDDQVWSLAASPEPASVTIDDVEGAPSSEDMAVVISIAHPVDEALRESDLPAFRGHVRLTGPDGGSADFKTAGEAVDAVGRTVDAMKKARAKWRDIRRIHLFIAGPAGFAVLLGQQLNGLGPIQTYEHLQDDGVGLYRRAALLHPGA